MIVAKEETSERLHSVHVVVRHTAVEADVRQSWNRCVILKMWHFFVQSRLSIGRIIVS